MSTAVVDQVVTAFRDALTDLLPPEDLEAITIDDIDRETQLLSLPMDSVVLMSVMNELEEGFAVFITEEAAFAFATVEDIAQYIQGRLDDKARRLAT